MSEFSLTVSTRLGSSQSSESKDDDWLHLVFNTNEWNICVTRTGPHLHLQLYFGGRFPLISSFFPFSVVLKFGFERRARQNSSRSFPGKLIFVDCSCCLPKVSGTELKSEDRKMTVVFSEAGGMTVGWGLWVCATSGRRFFCNSGTCYRNFKQTTRDVALRFFQDHFHHINDGCRETSLFSETRLQR